MPGQFDEEETILPGPESATGVRASALAPASGDEPIRVIPSDVAAFCRVVAAMGLIAPEELAGLAADRPPDDVAGFARVLVGAERLTAYQAAALLQGKERGLVIGNYFVLDKLGAGGMGVVFKAKHRRLSPVVALKILPPSFGRDRDAVTRFRREVDVAARIDHPNVVAALDADEDRGVHFLVMEYIAGRDLDRVVQADGPLPVARALQCLIQAARGLEAAHAQGIVHRDMKPSNLMLDDAGTVRVLDLGLAKVIDAANALSQAGGPALTRSGSFLGTPYFMAPEQADDSRKADHRADIYSLGCTLFFLLTGRPPFKFESILKLLLAHQERPAPSLRALRSDVSEEIEAVYQRMMAKKPSQRPQSMGEVATLLEARRPKGTSSRKTADDLIIFADSEIEVFVEKKPEPAPVATPPRNNARPLRVDHGPDLAALVSEGLDESIPLAPTTPRIGAIPIRGRGRRERAWSWIDDLRALMLGAAITTIGVPILLVLLVTVAKPIFRDPTAPPVLTPPRNERRLNDVGDSIGKQGDERAKTPPPGQFSPPVVVATRTQPALAKPEVLPPAPGSSLPSQTVPMSALLKPAVTPPAPAKPPVIPGVFWAVLGAGNYLVGNFPPGLSETVDELKLTNQEVKWIGLAPGGGWVLLYGRNGYKGRNIDSALAKALDDLARQNADLLSVNFSPSGGWVVLTNGTAFRAFGVSPEVMTALQVEEHYKRIGSSWLSFGPNDSCVIIFRDGRVFPKSVSEVLIKLLAATRPTDGGPFFFTHDGGWFLRTEGGSNDSVYTATPEMRAVIREVAALVQKRRFRSASFAVEALPPAPPPQAINVQEKLEMRIDLNFPNPTSLKNVLDYIKKATRGPNDAGLPIEVDLYGRNIYGGNIALSSVRPNPENSMVSIDVKAQPLKTSLRQVLKPLGLTYVTTAERVIIIPDD